MFLVFKKCWKEINKVNKYCITGRLYIYPFPPAPRYFYERWWLLVPLRPCRALATACRSPRIPGTGAGPSYGSGRRMVLSTEPAELTTPPFSYTGILYWLFLGGNPRATARVRRRIPPSYWCYGPPELRLGPFLCIGRALA